MFLRFLFNEDNPNEFFGEELASLMEQYANLTLLGFGISTIDLANRKIYLKQDEAIKDDDIKLVQEDVEKESKICKNCISFIASTKPNTPGRCSANNYATYATEECGKWTKQ